MEKTTLMIGMGAILYKSREGRQMIEAQTVSGLKGWKRNFDRIVGYAIASDQDPPDGWIDAIENGIDEPYFKIIPLPNTYNLSRFSDGFKGVEALMLDEMNKADYRVFSYGGWLGDPGEIAASIARKNNIKHAVWLDRVESQVVRSEGSGLKRIKGMIKGKIIERNEKRAVRNATLSLLHGATVYRHFEDIAKNPHVAEDIHYSQSDRIDSEGLEQKLKSCLGGPLKISYVGRADPMKGGKQWVEVLKRLKGNNIEFDATWYGTGSQISVMEQEARSSGLSEAEVKFPGFVADREKVKAAYQQSHIFLFCHLTDESPRNLIESLHAATPLIGYDDPFARSLVSENQGGLLVERGQITGLVDAISSLAADRARLGKLIERAAQSASRLTYETIFDERSEIIKRELA